MKWRFAWVYRLGLLALALVAGWGIWVEAQTTPDGGGADRPVIHDHHPDEEPGTKDWVRVHLSRFLDQVPVLRDTTLLNQPLWKYIAFALFIILAFNVAKLIDVLVNVWLKRLTSRPKTDKDDLLLELLRGPVKLVAFVVFLQTGLGLFDWPLRAQLLLSRALIIVVAYSVTCLAIKLVDLVLGLWHEKIAGPEDRVFAKLLLPLISKVCKVGLVIAAVLLTAENLDIKTTSALAGLSVGGLALGLAAQDTVANLFGAVAISLDRPFYIGDIIKVEGVEGAVESIGLRSTRVRNGDGHHVVIPNKLMGNAIITNVTRRPTIKSQINLGLTYDTPARQVARAAALLEEIFRANPKTSDLIISFNKFGDSALNILVIHDWLGTDAKEHFAAMQALNLQIKERFDAEKIAFAFPTRTVYLRQESPQMESPGATVSG